MNPLFIFRSVVGLIQTLKSTQETIKDESKEFDEEAGVKASPAVKTVAHATIWGKVILLAMLAGDLPLLDWFDIGGSEIFEWAAVILICGCGILGLVSHWDYSDKDDQRQDYHRRREEESRQQRALKQRQERQRRKDSNFLPDI